MANQIFYDGLKEVPQAGLDAQSLKTIFSFLQRVLGDNLYGFNVFLEEGQAIIDTYVKEEMEWNPSFDATLTSILEDLYKIPGIFCIWGEPISYFKAKNIRDRIIL